MTVWFGAPFFMVMYLASLKSVPQELYEAASIDGAGWWQRLRYVTLPLMRNIIAITMLFSLIGSFAGFTIVAVLTNGGPLGTTQVLATAAFLPRHRGRQSADGRRRGAVHGADPGGVRDRRPAAHRPAGERERRLTVGQGRRPTGT